MDLFETNGADFSNDRKHRFALWRIWDQSKPLVMFIGLNPSTANENTDDNTIKRVKSIAKNLGYGGIYMCNVFTFISTDPKALENIDNINTNHLNYAGLPYYHSKCSDVIFAWGNFDIIRSLQKDIELKNLFPNAKALHINKNGSPKHPLYCKKDITPIPYI